MAVARVILNNTTLVDMTDATASADKVLSNYTAYVKDGSKVSGSINFSTIYTGSSTPSASTGIDGDIYIQT